MDVTFRWSALGILNIMMLHAPAIKLLEPGQKYVE